MRSSVLQRLEQYDRWRQEARSGMTTSRKVLWTFGNVLILVGMLMIMFVGGLLADEQYNVYAASGDNDVGTAEVVALPSSQPTANEAAPAAQPTTAPERTRFNIPILNTTPDSALTNAVPRTTSNGAPSSVTRIVIPQIGLDKKVLEVGWKVENIDGQEVAIWDVDKYRVGHHKGTSNPGDGGNVVLAGHSGGKAYPFNDIFFLKQGDLIELYSNGQLYDYRVSDHILVDEVGQSIEKRLENARYIEPTDQEYVTMVACWPLTGPNKFNQRIIIRAKPASAPTNEAQQALSNWAIR